MPPWLEHAPGPPLLIVPSVHFTIAVFPAVLPVDFGFVVSAGLGGFGVVVFGLAVVVVVAGLLSLVDVAAFFTPPWLEHAPRPVAVEVVPSLQVTSRLLCLCTRHGRETRERCDRKER